MQTIYGLVSPLDQEGKNFYLQNEDGLVEVKLTNESGEVLSRKERKAARAAEQ